MMVTGAAFWWPLFVCDDSLISRGVGDLRPRRARCGSCLVTHVLLAVSCLLRRADVVDLIGAALRAKASGAGVADRQAGVGSLR